MDNGDKSIAGLRKMTAYIMTLSDEEIVKRVPVQTPKIHNACPNCHIKMKKRDKHWDDEQPHCFGKIMGHDKIYDPKKPNQYTCPKCKEVYPNNPKFPLDHSMVCYNQLGEKITVRYFLNPKGFNPRDKGDPQKNYPRHYYLEGVLDTARHHWLSPQMYALAKLYYLTGDKEAGHRAMVILNGYADRWPKWLFVGNYGHDYDKQKPGRTLGGWVSTREGRRSSDEHNGPMNYLSTVDLMMGSDAMKSYAVSTGIDIKDKLWGNVIALILDRYRASWIYPEFCMNEFGQGCPVALIDLARVFNRAELIRNATIKGLEYTPRIVMGIDGIFMQGTGYGQIHLSANRGMRNANGYSDPVDFKVPAGEKKIKDYRYPYGQHEKFWMKAYKGLARMRMPDGGVPVINDSGHLGYINWIPGINMPITESRDEIFNGYGYALLGDGNEEEQIQLHLNYSPNSVNHGHQDALTPQIFAFGHYLMSDTDYCKNTIRRYGQSTAGHNTVVVDYSQQGGDMPFHQQGDPKLYDGRAPGIKVISVDAPRAYLQKGVTEYRRTLIMNTYELKRPYIIDVFQVKGGKVRDYMLASSTQHRVEPNVDFSLPLKKFAGETPLLPDFEKGKLHAKDMGSGYKLFFNVKEGDGQKNSTVNYKVLTPWKIREEHPIEKKKGIQPLAPFKYNDDSYQDNPPVGTKHHIVGMPGQKVFLFESPDTHLSIIKGHFDTKYKEWDQIPHMILRQESDSGEEATFVVIHEPWLKKPKIKSVVKVKNDNPNVMALEIKYADRTDTVFISLSGSTEACTVEGVEFDGRIGVIASKAGKTESFLLGGTKLVASKEKVNLISNLDQVEGEIIQSYRKWNGDPFDGFAIKYSGALPNGDDLAGAFAVISNDGKLTNFTKKKIQNYKDELMLRRAYAGVKKAMGNVEKQGGDLDALFEKYSSAGAGWGIVIDHVEKQGEYLIVYTKDDHGLEIKDGTTEEFCVPARKFNKTSSLTIYPMVASQRAVEVYPAGGAFMKPVKVTLKYASSGAEIYYSIGGTGKSVEPFWLPYGKPIFHGDDVEVSKINFKWIKYSEPFMVDESSDIWVKAVNEDGFRKQLPKKYSFALPSTTVVDVQTISKGFKHTINKCKFSNLSGKYKNGRIRIPTLAKKLKVGEIIVEDTVLEINADQMIKLCKKKRIQAQETFTGTIKVPASGVYTIFFRADNDGELFIDGKQYVYGQGEECTPMPYAFQIPLNKGYLPIKVVYRFTGGSSARPALELEWIRPDGRRENMGK